MVNYIWTFQTWLAKFTIENDQPKSARETHLKFGSALARRYASSRAFFTSLGCKTEVWQMPF